MPLSASPASAGAAGIYAALGGESYRFSQEEFERYIKPYDLRSARRHQKKKKLAGELNILHMCKDNVRRSPTPTTRPWSTGARTGKSPAGGEGRALFGRPILGGVHFRGPVVNEAESAIRDRCTARWIRLGAQGLLLGGLHAADEHALRQHPRRGSRRGDDGPATERRSLAVIDNCLRSLGCNGKNITFQYSKERLMTPRSFYKSSAAGGAGIGRMRCACSQPGAGARPPPKRRAGLPAG